MYTLVGLTPPPVRLYPTGGDGSSWRKQGSYIIRDNPSQLSGGRLTPDDWEEGARRCLDMLFLESPTIDDRVLDSYPNIIDTGTSEKKKKPYTPKSNSRKRTKIFGKLY